MIYIRLIPLVAAMGLLLACGEPKPSRVTPDATATIEPSPISPPVSSPSPYPTPVPALTPIVSTGWAVAMFEDGLYAVEIDRTNVAPGEPYGERISLTTVPVTGPRGATYAGYLREGGDTWVYAVQIPSPDTPNPDAMLVRTSLTDGRQEERFSFKTTMTSRDGILPDPSAAVSPDGRYIAYTDIDGLQLFVTAADMPQRQAEDSCPEGVPFEKCNSYTAPIWSSDSERLLVTKQLYEGSHLVYADLRGVPNVISYTQVPGERKAWSIDGAYFCALNETFVPGGVFVGTDDPGQAIDIAASIPGTPQMCAWSAPNRLAIAYSQEVVSRPDLGLTIPRTIISIRDAASADVSMLELQVPLPQTRLAGWIPSGEGLLLHTTPACEPEPCPDMILSGVMALDGSYQGFAFNPATVLAIIPGS